jgi:hypothetical protein
MNGRGIGMKTELEQKLIKKYPKLFNGINKSPIETCMCFGIETGDGWFDLLDNCCSELSTIDADIELVQVKEKFGGLRIYLNNYPEGALEITNKYEEESYKTCELCGSKEGVKSTYGWIMVRCAACLKKQGEQQGYPVHTWDDEEFEDG